MSAESGIETFRGDGGHWRKHNAYDLASPEGFKKDPGLVWEWYVERRQKVLSTKPNPGHYAIAELESLFSDKFYLITQNVDGLHQQAGSKNVLPIHGDIWKARCTKTGFVKEDRELHQGIPYCQCGAMLRPHILWFGDNYDSDLKSEAFKAIRVSEVIFVVGTSGAIRIVHDLMNKAYLTYCVEVNVEKSEVNWMMDKFLQGKSGEIFPQIVEEFKKSKG